MTYRHLTKLAETLSEHIGRSEATISNKIAGHARLFERERKGLGCTIRTLERGLDWFHENWPEDLQWPSGIPRPTPNKKDAA